MSSLSASRMLVERSFGFVDLCGFTDHLDTRGVDAALAEVGELRKAVRGAAQAHGVRVDKWLGDGAMLVGVEPGPVLSALADIARTLMLGTAALEVRAGFARGPVALIEGDDYVGRAVNLAARLCDLAEPGEMLVTPASLAEGRPVVKRLTVKGFTRPVEVAVLSPDLFSGPITLELFGVVDAVNAQDHTGAVERPMMGRFETGSELVLPERVD